MTGRRALRLHPFEWLTYGSTAAIVAFLRASGLRMDWRTVEFMAGPMLLQLPIAAVIGVGLHAAALAAERRRLGAGLRALARPQSLLTWLRIWVAAMAMTYAYSWLKISVPLLRHRVLDAELWSLDAWLHFGIAPAVFAAELVAGTPVAAGLDVWYSLWVLSVTVALAYVSLLPEMSRRRNFAFACAVLWIAGAGIYYALPAVGPCYARPEAFAEVRAETPRSAAAQERLWANYRRLVAGRDGSLSRFNPYLGVAAMPSLHVGAHVLFALWARRHGSRLFVPLAVGAGLTFFASLATAWHYAIDGYVGALLAWLALTAADRWEPVAGAAAGESAAEPREPAA